MGQYRTAIRCIDSLLPIPRQPFQDVRGSRGLRSAALGAVTAAAFAIATPVTAQEGLLVYVPNQASDSISVFRTNADGSLSAVTTIGGIGSAPVHAAVRGDQAFAYVTLNDDDRIAIIDTATNTVIDTVPTGDAPRGIAVSPDGTRVYVANNGSGANSVSVFSADPLTGQLTPQGTIGTGPLTQPRDMVLSPDGSQLYVANQGGDNVQVVNTTTDAIIATITVGDTPVALAVSPDGTRMYVSNFASNSVSVIDTSTNTVVGTVASPSPFGISVSPDGEFFYVAIQNDNDIRQFDASTHNLVGTISLPDGNSRPSRFVFTPNGAFAYAADTNNFINQVRMFGMDAATGTPASFGTVAAGTSPQMIALCGGGNAMLASGAVFVANTAAALDCTGGNAEFTGGTLLVNDANLDFDTPMTLHAQGGAIDTNGNATTVSASISGTGGLTKSGAGTLTLSGANTYTGATNVDAGTLQAGAANVFGSNSATTVAAGAVLDLNGFAQSLGALAGAGDVTLGTAALTVGDATSTTFSGTISGSGGSLIKIGTGTLTLTGTATYDGGTTVTAGTLQGTTTSLQGAITNNANVAFDQATTGTYAGVMSGTGSLTKSGTGTLILTGANTYSGGTTVTAGTLQGTTTSLQGAITNDANVTFDQATTGTYAGVMTGTGSLTKAGTDSLTLTGNNAYTGATRIDNGLLVVNGSIANSTVTVNDGGGLGGTGTLGTVLLNGGTLAPGNSIGAMNVAGDVDFSGGGVYAVEVDADGNSDLIAATGAATLSGGSVLVTPLAGNYGFSTTYTILTAAGGLNGTAFDSASSTFAFLIPELSYDANTVSLTLRRGLEFAQAAATPNQIAVSQVLDQLADTRTSGMEDIFDNLVPLTMDGARQAFDGLSGVAHANVQSIVQRLGSPFWQLLQERLPGDSVLERGAWARAYDYFGEIDDTINASGADYDTRGLAFGVDRLLTSELAAGLGASYLRTGAGSFQSDADVDTWQLGAYAGWQRGPYYLNGDTGYVHHKIDTSRQIGVGLLAVTAHADYSARQIVTNLEGGRIFALRAGSFTPFLGMDYAHLARESFTETNAGAAGLTAPGGSEDSLRTRLGMRFSRSFETTGTLKFTPVAGIAYVREHWDSVSQLRAAFSAAPDTAFLIEGPALDRDRLSLQAGLMAALTEHSHLNVDYKGELWESGEQHAFSVTFRFEW